MTNKEKQFEIEAERSLATIEQAIGFMELTGGDIRLFSYAMLRASAHLFAEINGAADLQKAIQHVGRVEEAHRRPCGRA